MSRWRELLSATVLPMACGACVLLLGAAGPGARPVGNAAQVQANDAEAVAAFEAMMPVLRHPRCMNCHWSGDEPRVGEDSRPHPMDVRRGVDGFGVKPVRCSTCHQDHNVAGLHAPPGAPEWGLPPAAMPMIWKGLTDRQVCELFKDPTQNGHRTGQDILQHLKTPLVLWAWDPGEGRAPVPMSKDEFLAHATDWVTHGAACPK